MGTPLKNASKLLYPRILSPVSPKYLSVLNHVSNVERTKPKFRKLDFLECDQTVLTPIKIHVTPVREEREQSVEKQDVLINTPNKQKIITNGLEDGRYFNILGQGRFGRVFKALYKGKSVVMKLVKKLSTNNREKNALSLNHQNIVNILEIIENENGKFSLIIMEYTPNCTNLDTIIRNSLFDIEYSKYAKDISEGILYCHKNGILHLDIKPSNILVSHGLCKICDFGNSFNLNENIISDYEFHGTIHYAAPEILLGKTPTEMADIYSMGVVFWQMKTRQLPYKDIDNIECIVYKVVKWNLRPDLEEPIDVFSNLYQKCWNKDPNERPEISYILQILYSM